MLQDLAKGPNATRLSVKGQKERKISCAIFLLLFKTKTIKTNYIINQKSVFVKICVFLNFLFARSLITAKMASFLTTQNCWRVWVFPSGSALSLLVVSIHRLGMRNGVCLHALIKAICFRLKLELVLINLESLPAVRTSWFYSVKSYNRSGF